MALHGPQKVPTASVLPSTPLHLTMLLWVLSFILLLHVLSVAPETPQKGHVSVILLGATGDLAKKWLWQGLFQLYLEQATKGYNFSIHGAALTEQATGEAWISEVLKALTCPSDTSAKHCAQQKDQFRRLSQYRQMKTAEDYASLNSHIQQSLEEEGLKEVGRLFYLSVPPFAYVDIARNINASCTPPATAWLRVVIEKPFGRDLESAKILANELRTFFKEEQLYRTDHYLGKQAVYQILSFRHQNHKFLEPLWNWHHVERVEIVLKESFDAKGRISFYEKYGVIRDVIQNHLTELLTYVAMEMPIDPDNTEQVLQRKLEMFKSLRRMDRRSAVIGQYMTYIEQARKELKKTQEYFSTTPTFAGVLVNVDNLRWQGVPFIMTSGKALDESDAYVRVLFKSQAFCTQKKSVNSQCQPRQIIFEIGDGGLNYTAILVSRNLFKPVLPESWHEVTDHPPHDHLFGQAAANLYIYRPIQEKDAYSILISNIFQGRKENFITTENLLASFGFWNPLLESLAHEIPRVYPGGTENGNLLDFTVLGSETSFVADDPVKLIGKGTSRHAGRDVGTLHAVFRGSPLVSGWTDELITGLAQDIQEAAEKSVRHSGTFHLALSGGSSPVVLLNRLVTHHFSFPWRNTHLWLADEQCVPLTDPESNFRKLHDHLLLHVRIPYMNIHPMPVHLNQRLCVEEDRGAELYAQDICKLVNNGTFDMIVLGVGDEGHTASLFPHSLEDVESDQMVILTESARRPHQRMSFTLSLLNKAQKVVVLVLGRTKHDIVTRIGRVGQDPRKWPITGVDPITGLVTWYIDYDALLQWRDGMVHL